MDAFCNEDEDENVVFFDSVSKSYVMNDILGRNTPSSPSHTSPFRGKSPEECWSLLKQLCTETRSVVHTNVFAIMDERSLSDDTVILVDMDEDDVIAYHARCDFKTACAKLHQYYIGDADFEQDLEEAFEDGDGVIRCG
jgi:hypothetical protein